MTPSDVRVVPGTRASVITDELRRMIVAGELAGGERLRQVEIAERFGVSTTPVREAFSALARAGLVRQDAHRGVIVFTPSLDDLRENYEIRGVLEPLATELAAERMTREDLDRLGEIYRQMLDNAKTDDRANTELYNPAFHATIYTAAGRPRLFEMIETLRDGSLAYHSLVELRDLPARYVDKAHREHREILVALRKHDGPRAAAAMKAHIANNMRQVLASLPELSRRE